MTEPVKEQLSACLDGELAEAELDLLLRQLQRNPELRRSMGRYSLLGEAMRGQRTVSASAGFADRVGAAIAGESLDAAALKTSVVSRWLRPAAGMAIAASVAALVVVSMRPAAVSNQQVIASTASAVESTEPAPSYTVPTTTDTTSAAFIPAARLTNYVVAHSEFSSPLGRRTVLSGVLSDDDDSQNDPDGSDVQISVTTPASGSDAQSVENQH